MVGLLSMDHRAFFRKICHYPQKTKKPPNSLWHKDLRHILPRFFVVTPYVAMIYNKYEYAQVFFLIWHKIIFYFFKRFRLQWPINTV